MAISKQKKIQHLFHRAGFGESISAIRRYEDESTSAIIKKIFDDSQKFTELNILGSKNSYAQKKEEKEKNELTRQEKKNFQKQSREDIRDLNIAWIDKMSLDKAQLREKMTFFWHGHFACKTRIGLFCQNQNNTIRKHALGKFGDLLMEISKDPAMLQFLNNQQNRKSSPNENFAREVMELFTLGRGNYTENDVKEAARAFTGWGFGRTGEFRFRKAVHDTDEKTCLSKSGNFTGEDIIQIILEQRRTSEFITEKIYRYFVNEKIDKNITAGLAKSFYDSGYNIESLMKEIFSSEWFYGKENIGSKIKSPVELIVGMIRSFNIDFVNPLPLLNLQKVLGQMLFNPPNVAGWAGGKSWIDSSSLMYRLKLPEIIFKSSNLNFDYKEDMPEMGDSYRELSKKEKKQYKQMNTKTDLKSYIKEFSEFDEDEIALKLSEYLLQVNFDAKDKKLVNKYSDRSTIENLIESVTLRIISLPEYQLC